MANTTLNFIKRRNDNRIKYSVCMMYFVMLSPHPLLSPLSPIYTYIFDKIEKVTAGLRNLLNFDVTKAKSAF